MQFIVARTLLRETPAAFRAAAVRPGSAGRRQARHALDRPSAVGQHPYEESDRYRRFMGWKMPWYSVPAQSHERLLAGRHFGMKVCYLRDGDHVYETYWTTGRGVEPMAPSYGILDMTVHGRQETWEDSPPGWPQPYEPRGRRLQRGPSRGADGCADHPALHQQHQQQHQHQHQHQHEGLAL